MTNAEYWRQRFRQLEAAQNSLGKQALRQIEEQYRQAERELEAQISRWYMRLAENNGISMAEARRLLSGNELAEFKWDVQEYIRRGQENALDGRWLRQLENASAKFHISRLEALKIHTRQSMEELFAGQQRILNGTLGSIYRSGYYHTAFELQRGFALGWDIAGINQGQLERILAKPWAVDGRNFSERIWDNKAKLIAELHNELSRGIMLGENPRKMIDAIASKLNVSRGNAGRLVMTESAYFSSAAQGDCYRELGVEEYQILATLDDRTSDICQEMDGQVFPMRDYEAGVTAPPFHVRCRSTTVPYFADNFGVVGKRAARGADGKTYYVPADMTYNEWKSTFVNGGDKTGLQEVSKGGKINKRPLFVPAETIKEAEEFARNELGIQNVSYKGVDIVTANAWNEGLYDSFNRFPELKQNFGFVGEAHERNAALKPVAWQYYLDELLKLNPGYSEEDLTPYVEKKIKVLMNKLKVSKNTFAQSFAPAHEVFSAFSGVTVNRDWGKDHTAFAKALLDDVSIKFHPVGCDTIRSVLDHEIGHQLDNLLDIREIDEIKKLFDSRTHEELTMALSQYTWDNDNRNRYSEMIAEAWSEYCNNPEPREIAKTVGNTIEREYRKKILKQLE